MRKPASVESDPFKSAKWDELTAGRSFSESDIPTLSLLVQWHAVVQRCIEDMDEVGGQVAYAAPHRASPMNEKASFVKYRENDVVIVRKVRLL